MADGEFHGWVDELRAREEEIVARIVQWANRNSGSKNAEGVTRFALKMVKALEPLTPAVEQISLPPAEEIADDGSIVRFALGPAVRAVCRPGAPIRVLLAGHLDTVFEGDHPFQRARQMGEQLIGPGVTDMKGGLAVMLEALRLLEKAPGREHIGWEVLLTPDEEIGSPRSAALLREAAGRCSLGLVFEPALPDGGLVAARAGSGNFLVRVQGRAAHAGRQFEHGRNAIVAVSKIVGELHALNEREGLTVNVGRVSGGGALNIVPDAAACRLNVRAVTAELARSAEEAIGAIANEVAERHEVEVAVDGAFQRPPKPLTPAVEAMLHDFRECARDLGWKAPLTWGATAGGSDANILGAAGLPVVDGLGVRGGGMHTDQEFLWIDSLRERIPLAALYLVKLARGAIEVPD